MSTKRRYRAPPDPLVDCLDYLAFLDSLPRQGPTWTYERDFVPQKDREFQRFGHGGRVVLELVKMVRKVERACPLFKRFDVRACAVRAGMTERQWIHACVDAVRAWRLHNTGN